MLLAYSSPTPASRALPKSARPLTYLRVLQFLADRVYNIRNGFLFNDVRPTPLQYLEVVFYYRYGVLAAYLK